MMVTKSEQAESVLKLFWGKSDTLFVNITDLNNADWSQLKTLIKKNVLPIRFFEKLTINQKEVQDKVFINFVESEKERIFKAVQLIEDIALLCKQQDIKYVFHKGFQHYPDMGHDIDLLVFDYSNRIDLAISKAFKVTKDKNSFTNRVASKVGYDIFGSKTSLEIHHGKMGHVGEHHKYPKILATRLIKSSSSSSEVMIPSNEDQLIIAVLQRMYSHFHFRLSDILHIVDILKCDLDWHYIETTCKQNGIYTGLKNLLGFIYYKYKQLTNEELIEKEVIIRNKVHDFDLQFDGNYYRISLLVIIKLYVKKILNDLYRRDFVSLFHLSSIPILTVIVKIRDSFRKMLTKYTELTCK